MLFGAHRATARSEIEMELSAAYQFGEHVTFTGRLVSPIQIQKASIFIHDTTQVVTHVQPVTFDQNGVSVFRFDTRRNVLRPFTTILWRYELTLPDGSVLQSATASIRYDDDRFAWQTLETDALRVHWYNSDGDFGVSALNAAQTGLQNIRGFFAPILSPPVDVFIYANESDLRGALYGAEAWVAGHADSAAGVITVTIEPGAEQGILMEQRIPHELMHVMLHRRVGAGYRNLPAWLSEGMAMLAEAYPNPNYAILLRDAAARDALIPIRDLCDSFSPRIDSAFLAYAESRSFTDYLRGLYGADGLLSLANAYANGVTCERGTERAFGVSLAKLERDWRVAALGQSGVASTLGDVVPYLILLCLVVFFPLVGIVNAMRKKGDRHAPERYAGRK
ncbi:MAG: hypothetical protein L6Q26_08430 [Anaerolineales bacterium]|nr:hypothetical protein [Anaerolineales bacterium]